MHANADDKTIDAPGNIIRFMPGIHYPILEKYFGGQCVYPAGVIEHQTREKITLRGTNFALTATTYHYSKFCRVSVNLRRQR